MDFDFLHGSFDIDSWRLRKPLTSSDDWDQARATSIAHLYFDGAVSIDEVYLPDDDRYGLSLRLYEPETGEWAVYWVTGDGELQPPARGRWVGGQCCFIGDDTYRDVPILATYEWSDITAESAKWQQAFSTDGGDSWEVNWQMDVRRRAEQPDHSVGPRHTDEFDFLNGRWTGVQSRRKDMLGGPDEWRTFPSTSVHRTYFNGAVSVDEFDFPTEGGKGLTMRLYSPRTQEWTIYWVSSRDGVLQQPVVGGFSGDRGVFRGPDVVDGTPVDVTFEWTWTDDTARWEQSFSTDGGRTWVPNWTMELTRQAGPDDAM